MKESKHFEENFLTLRQHREKSKEILEIFCIYRVEIYKTLTGNGLNESGGERNISYLYLVAIIIAMQERKRNVVSFVDATKPIDMTGMRGKGIRKRG